MVAKKTNAWVLRYQLPYKQDLPTEKFVVFVDRGRLKISPGDKVVLLEDKVPIGLQFFAHTTVASVEPVKSTDNVPLAGSTEQKALKLTLEPPTRLDPARQLSTFAQSLISVTKHKTPAKQFSRSKIKKISLDDYDTIVEGEIFVARTFFIKTYIGMSRNLRFRFQTYCMKHGCDLTASNVSFGQRAQLMIDFVKTHILPLASYVLVAKKLYEGIECAEKPRFEKLMTSSDNGQSVRPFGSLAVPAAEIVKLAEGQQGILDIVVGELSNDSEFRFEGLKWTAIQW